MANKHPVPPHRENVPYVLMFGQKPRVGISNLPLEKNVIDNLHTESQLNMVVDVKNVKNKSKREDD